MEHILLRLLLKVAIICPGFERSESYIRPDGNV